MAGSRAPGRADGWGRIVLQTTTLGSSQETTGLVRESFLEAALTLGVAPMSAASDQATNAVKTPPHVPGLNLVFMSPQVPCRLRAARSQTKASTSVWRPTLQAHATRPPPTCMCEVRTRALQCGPCLQGAELPLLAVDTRGLPSPVSSFPPLSAAVVAAAAAAAPTEQAHNVHHHSAFLPCRPFGKQLLLGAFVSLIGPARGPRAPWESRAFPADVSVCVCVCV